MRLRAKERTKRKNQRKKKLEEQRLKEEKAHLQPAFLAVVSRASSQSNPTTDKTIVEVEKQTYRRPEVISNSKIDECCTVSDPNGESKRDIYQYDLQRNSLEGSVSCE